MSARKTNPKRKPRSGSPRSEPPAIPANPQAALDKLLRQRDRDTKADFYAAHRDGTDALKRRDLRALDDAIKRERQAIDRHSRLINRTRRK